MVHAVNCGNPICKICYPAPDPSVDILAALNADNYRLGNLQIVQYDPHNIHIARYLPDNFLSQLYLRMKADKILTRTFCGMQDLSHDAIVKYLSGHPLFMAVEWREDTYNEDTYNEGACNRESKLSPHLLGFGFIVTWIGVPPPNLGPRAAFGAYGFFRESWGQPEAEILGMLGLAKMFYQYKLSAIWGQRQAFNRLTAKFMARYGFRDIVSLPEFILYNQRGEGNHSEPVLGSCEVSRLTRKDFTLYVEKMLATLA